MHQVIAWSASLSANSSLEKAAERGNKKVNRKNENSNLKRAKANLRAKEIDP